MRFEQPDQRAEHLLPAILRQIHPEIRELQRANIPRYLRGGTREDSSAGMVLLLEFQQTANTSRPAPTAPRLQLMVGSPPLNRTKKQGQSLYAVIRQYAMISTPYRVHCSFSVSRKNRRSSSTKNTSWRLRAVSG